MTIYNSSILASDIPEQRLEEMYGDEDYYWYLRSPEFQETFLKPLADCVNNVEGSTLDVCCGEGQLAQFVEGKYCGFDGSRRAILKAQRRYPVSEYPDKWFIVRRLEETHSIGDFDFEKIVFGGVLHCLIAPESRVDFIRSFQDLYGATHFFVYDLERLDTSDLDNEFACVSSYVNEIPSLEHWQRIVTKRKILCYRYE